MDYTEKIKKAIDDFIARENATIKRDDFSQKVEERLFKDFMFPGLIMYADKSYGYKEAKKKNKIYVPNGNIFISGGYKVWYGDIFSDKKTLNLLKSFSKEFNTTFYILKEHDGRFLSQSPDDKYLEEKYVIRIQNEEVLTKEI